MYRITRCDENIEDLNDANETETFRDHEINQMMLWLKDSIFNGQYNAIYIWYEHDEVQENGPWKMSS